MYLDLLCHLLLLVCELQAAGLLWWEVFGCRDHFSIFKLQVLYLELHDHTYTIIPFYYDLHNALLQPRMSKPDLPLFHQTRKERGLIWWWVQAGTPRLLLLADRLALTRLVLMSCTTLRATEHTNNTQTHELSTNKNNVSSEVSCSLRSVFVCASASVCLVFKCAPFHQ